MLNLIKKYKFVILFILILLFFICINNNVNASSFTSLDGNVYQFNITDRTITDYCIFEYSNGNIYLYDLSSYEYKDLKEIVIETTDYTFFFKGNKDNYHSRPYYPLYKYDKSINNFKLISDKAYRIEELCSINCLYSTMSIYLAKDTTKLNKIGYLYKEGYSSSLFYLEYDEKLNSYVVCTKWANVYKDSSYEDMHSYYFKINPSEVPTDFDIKTCLDNGWTDMRTNDIGPGLEYDCTDEYYDNITTKEELMGINFRCRLQIIDYGTYYFCCYNYKKDEQDDSKKFSYNIVRFVFNEEGNSYIETLDKNTNTWTNRTNIDIDTNISLKNNFNMYVIYDNYSAIIYSNYFKYDDRYVYTVTYSYDGVSYIDDMLTENYGVDTANNEAGYYRYYKEVTENRTYYFRLQIFDPENNGALVDTKYIEVVVDGDFYLNQTFEDIDYYRKSAVYRILKKKLGILFYPIDVTFEFFERLSKIEMQEPSISVPTIREYFTQAIIINGFTFSLNDVLQNETINQVYNIYLMFVDFIIYCLLFRLLYKVFKEFFNVGGLFNG